jgi:cytochrome c2
MRLQRLIVLALSLSAGPALAAERGDPVAGRNLVERSCTVCHTTENARTARDTAPPLSVLAKDNKNNPGWLRGWLMDPHPPAPRISLSRQQIEDVIAYLDSLPAS